MQVEVYVIINKKTKKPVKEAGLFVYTNKAEAKDVANKKEKIQKAKLVY